jgi:holliday junction DNA helicase RuvA
MIAIIEGKIAAALHDSLVVMVNGIGYKIFVPDASSGRPGEEIRLFTSLIVREDSMTLYGFRAEADRGMFETLLMVSGVGPRVALSILNTLSADNLRNAVVSERAEILTRVPGIGKKTAQKILFELKDRLPRGLDAMPVDTFDDVNSDVIDTLVALGYSIVEAQTAVQALPHDAPQDVEERVRLALQYFA